MTPPDPLVCDCDGCREPDDSVSIAYSWLFVTAQGIDPGRPTEAWAAPVDWGQETRQLHPRFDVNTSVEADTKTMVITVLVSGADGRSAPRRSVGGCTSPVPRAVLFYTLLELFPAFRRPQCRR